MRGRSLLALTVIGLIATAGIAASGSVAFAKKGGAAAAKGKQGADKREKGADKREKVREKVREFRNNRLTELLGLDQATATKLFAVLNKYDDLFLPLRIDLGLARRELRRMVESGQIDEARANTLMDTIVAKKTAIETLERERFAEVRKVLPARDAARVMVVLPEIERAIENEIRKALKKRGVGDAGAPDLGDGGDAPE
jgi:Spy/CpxP family protein refolding chaperone